MKIVGFNFSKINIEKINSQSNNLKLNTNINVEEIKELKSDILKTKDQMLGVAFEYTINYNPDFAKIEFKGNILVSLDQKRSKEILKKWKENEIDQDFKIDIFNVILKKSNIKALQLEEELNLPLHIKLPFISKENQQDQNQQGE